MSYETHPEEVATPLPLRAALRRTGETASYPFVGLGQPQGFMYVGLGLAGEAGEIANQIKKITRDDGGLLTTARREKIFEELGDVMWYWLRICDEMGFDPDGVVQANLAKLRERKATGTLHGGTVNGQRVVGGLATGAIGQTNVVRVATAREETVQEGPPGAPPQPHPGEAYYYAGVQFVWSGEHWLVVRGQWPSYGDVARGIIGMDQGGQ